MKSLTLSNVLSILALSLLASIIPACGGGSSRPATASFATPPAFEGKIHVSTAGAPVLVPSGSSAGVLVRQITFTPTNANDVLLYFKVEGDYTMAATSNTFIGVETFDAGMNSVCGAQTGFIQAAGSNQPFSFGGPVMMIPALVSSAPQFPSAQYTIKITCVTNTQAITLSNLVIKVFTMEGVQLISPSGNIVG